MKKTVLNLLLVVACAWSAAVRAEVSVSEAQILTDAGYSYSDVSGAWNDASGKAIEQNKIVDLFSSNVIDLTVKIAKSDKTPAEAERAEFLAAVKREIASGKLAFSVGKPEGDKVTVASLTKEEMRDAMAMPAALKNAKAAASVQNLTWDGSNAQVMLIKGGGSSSRSSGGSSSRSSGSSSRGSSSSSRSSGSSSRSSGSSSRSSGSSSRSSGSSSRGSSSAPRGGGGSTRTPSRPSSPSTPSRKPSTSPSTPNRKPSTSPSTPNRKPSTSPSTPAKKPSSGGSTGNRQPKNPVVDKKPLPGGGSKERRKDGSVRETRPMKDGGRETVVKRPNGGSTRTVQDKNGNKTQTITRVNKRTGKSSTTEIRTGKDGSRETRHSNGARSVRSKDGTRTHISPKGHRTTVGKYEKGNNGRYSRSRTTVINNRTVRVTNNYRTVHRGGRSYYSYSPFFHPYLYSPLWSPFYYHPWASPYYYGWGWYPYSYYSWYYTPYPYYTSPFFWLTDFVIRDAIYSSYQRNEGSSNESAESQPSQEQQKQAISEEVKAQVAAQVEQAMKDLEAKREPVLEKSMNTNTVFVVNEEMTVTQTDENGEEGEACTLDSGDIVRLAAVPAESDVVATMKVVSSKSGGCDVKSTVSMSMENVQEMFNEFNERLEKGVVKMKEEKEAGTLKIGK